LKKLIVIIPALDEQLSLQQLLPLVVSELSSLTEWNSEILTVIGVGSAESDIQEILDSGAVPVIRGPSNTFGDAIRTGLQVAQNYNPECILIMDADGSHSPKTIPRLVKTMSQGNFDIVIASRYTPGGGSHNSLLLKLMSRLLNFTYSMVLGIAAKDVSTNYKIYRADLLSNIHLVCQNFDVVEEILLEIKRIKNGNLVIKEIPDHFEKRVLGESKRNLMLFILSYVTTLFRLRFRKIR
jgi:dolichol-phosphate mannosyltransferase